MSHPRSSAEHPWPVRVVSQKIADWIARLGEVWVEGQVTEVSNRRGASSNAGTVFCTLRDPSANISVTVTARRATFDAIDPPLTEGARVIVRGKFEFYPGRGTLTLRATEFRPVGIGELLARLEQLKKLLAAEGLFAPERKRPLPFLPSTIGLITGRASAAERDVRRNAEERWPSARFKTRNVAVQGPSAVPEIVTALYELDADDTVDVIVIARGGGSVEDLLPFSDETLCRAVFAAKTPVVSAIGHEPDSPLLDYVADLRASTPTDAGKRIVPSFTEEVDRLRIARDRLAAAINGRLRHEQQWLDAHRSRPALAAPTQLLDHHAAELASLQARAHRHLHHCLTNATDELTHTLARLRALSPKSTLNRGYAIVTRTSSDPAVKTTQIVRSETEVDPGDNLRIRVANGEFSAKVH